MPGLTDILNTARDALAAQSYGLGVAGQNVANVNTPGYVRRRADLESQPLGSQTFGTVIAKGITRITDQYIEQRHYGAVGLSSSASETDGMLGQIEALFSIDEGQDLGTSLSEVFAAFSQLTTDPKNLSLRTQVLTKAETFATRVSAVSRAVANFRTELTKQAASTTTDINQIANSIAEVNRKIAVADAGGFDAADLKDQRDSMLLDLSELVDVRTFTNGQGQLVVQASGSTLIEGDVARNLDIALDPSGNLQVLSRTQTGAVTDVSAFLTGGKLAAIRDVHDTHTTQLLTQLDNFTYDIATAINTQHQAGFGLTGVSGLDLFDVSGGAVGAAQNIKLNAALIGQPQLVAASATTTGLPGDADNALAIAQLADIKLANTSTQTGAEAFGSILADVGNRKRTAEFDTQVRTAMTDQVYSMRESVSGVNLDEEMVSLTKYQRAYQAASRVLTTADQLLEELMTRVGR